MTWVVTVDSCKVDITLFEPAVSGLNITLLAVGVIIGSTSVAGYLVHTIIADHVELASH